MTTFVVAQHDLFQLTAIQNHETLGPNLPDNLMQRVRGDPPDSIFELLDCGENLSKPTASCDEGLVLRAKALGTCADR